jgi:hypothetical protein
MNLIWIMPAEGGDMKTFNLYAMGIEVFYPPSQKTPGF